MMQNSTLGFGLALVVLVPGGCGSAPSESTETMQSALVCPPGEVVDCQYDPDTRRTLCECIPAPPPPPPPPPIQLIGPDAPGQWTAPWTNDVQGIAHNDSLWYITNETRICKFPRNEDITHFGDWYYPEWWCQGPLFQDDKFHYGDLDVSNGLLFVPIEGTGNPILSILRDRFPDTYVTNGFPALVDVEEARIEMPYSGNFAWLAISPGGDTLWSATQFYDVSTLAKYSIHWPSEGENFYGVDPAGEVPITWGGWPYTLHDIQGGVFSPTGLLYLVSGNPDPNAGGIYAVDTNGAITAHLAYGYTPATCGIWPIRWDCGDEPEGIDFLDQGQTQLHLIQVDNNSGTDELSIKHFRAYDPR